MANSVIKEGYNIDQFNIHLCSQGETLEAADLIQDGEEKLFYYTRIDQAPNKNSPEPWFVLLASPYPIELADAKIILEEFRLKHKTSK